MPLAPTVDSARRHRRRLLAATRSRYQAPRSKADFLTARFEAAPAPRRAAARIGSVPPLTRPREEAWTPTRVQLRNRRSRARWCAAAGSRTRRVDETF